MEGAVVLAVRLMRPVSVRSLMADGNAYQVRAAP